MVLPQQLFPPDSRTISESPRAPFVTVHVAGCQTWLRQCLHLRLCICWLSNSHIHLLTLVLNLFLSLKKNEESLKNIPYTSEFLDKETSVFLPLK